jgi:hypothetical protein
VGFVFPLTDDTFDLLFPFFFWLPGLNIIPHRMTKYVRNYGDRPNNLDSVSKCASIIFSFQFLLAQPPPPTDLRGKFSAIHREYSPNPRKFYAFCTSVTDTATTAGIIASGQSFCLFNYYYYFVLMISSIQVRDMVIRQHLKSSKLL